MFICIVSYHYTVMDNMEMRVVGQGCAYPQWLQGEHLVRITGSQSTTVRLMLHCTSLEQASVRSIQRGMFVGV